MLVQSNLPIPSKYQYFFDWCVDNNHMSIILMPKKHLLHNSSNTTYISNVMDTLRFYLS